jgi:hypothetical protein
MFEILSSSILNCTLHYWYLYSPESGLSHQNFLLPSDYILMPIGPTFLVPSFSTLSPATGNHLSTSDFPEINFFKFHLWSDLLYLSFWKLWHRGKRKSVLVIGAQEGLQNGKVLKKKYTQRNNNKTFYAWIQMV